MMLSSPQSVASPIIAAAPSPLLLKTSGGLRTHLSFRAQNGYHNKLTIQGSKRRSTVPGVRAKVTSVDSSNFETEVLQSELPVLVDFWAKWCGPCKLVATSIDVLDRKYAGQLKVVKIETDPNPELKEKYKVYGLPTLIMFMNGEVMAGGRYEGAVSLAKLESMIKKVLPSLAAVN